MGEHFYAPVAGETVRNDTTNADGGADVGGFVNGRWQPGGRTRRSSLHDVRLRPSAVQEESPPEPVEAPQYAPPYAQTYDAPQQAAADFTQGNDMASNHHGGLPPDPTQFDMYDEESARDYNQQLAAYIDGRVASALTPSRQAQSEAQLASQYNQCVEQFGSDGNFKEAMDEALEQSVLAAKAGRAIDIVKAYASASESISRRPGKKNAHLPERAKTIRGLGALLDFNHRTGRARPYRGR